MHTPTHTQAKLLSSFAAVPGQNSNQRKITLEDKILTLHCVISQCHAVDSAAGTAGYETVSGKKLTVMGLYNT